jgi:hypothetical protein
MTYPYPRSSRPSKRSPLCQGRTPPYGTPQPQRYSTPTVCLNRSRRGCLMNAQRCPSHYPRRSRYGKPGTHNNYGVRNRKAALEASAYPNDTGVPLILVASTIICTERKPTTEPVPRTTDHRVSVRVVQDKRRPKYRVVIGRYRLPPLVKRSTYRVAIGYYLFYNPMYRVVYFTVFLYTCDRQRDKDSLFVVRKGTVCWLKIDPARDVMQVSTR